MLSDGKGEGFEVGLHIDRLSAQDSLEIGAEVIFTRHEYEVKHHPAEDGKSAYTECFLETIHEPIRIAVSKLPTLKINSDWQCRCLIDGHDLSYPVWLKNSPYDRWKSIYEQDGDQYYQCSLQFSPIPTTDSVEQVTIKTTALENLGNIEISLERGWYIQSIPVGLTVSALTAGVADEKAKKRAVGVRLWCMLPYIVLTLTICSAGDRTVVSNKTRTSYTFLPHTYGETYYRFIFKYRPRIVLQKAHIIDEPELEQPAMPRKRKRAASPTVTLVDSEVEEDVKPLLAKRLKYLEVN
ncbi:hypothetical protein I316_06673 [Kwoniella heveanensis BCC8398]|uniref:Uncharacterized protein n=1 Tax=Kwoniella heveanensis BCC8398 TaxID=1296120 RepID=A0A1B9GL06_9TREE|nr:hypothetical protein I316_06673 [Kwoniella heveanensis BCC8398]